MNSVIFTSETSVLEVGFVDSSTLGLPWGLDSLWSLSGRAGEEGCDGGCGSDTLQNVSITLLMQETQDSCPMSAGGRGKTNVVSLSFFYE